MAHEDAPRSQVTRRLNVTLSLLGRAKAGRLASFATAARDNVEEILDCGFFATAPFSSIGFIVRLGPALETKVTPEGVRKGDLMVIVEAAIDGLKECDEEYGRAFFKGLFLIGCLTVGERYGLDNSKLENAATQFRLQNP
jgi:hypothetical protein